MAVDDERCADDVIAPSASTTSGAARQPATERPRPDWNSVIGRRSQRTDPIPDVVFATALRGYDCKQVDELIARLVERCRTEIVRADGAESDLGAALDRVSQLDRQVREGVDALRAGFGERVERLLAEAERDAAALRAAAIDDASEIRREVRAEAEHHRHQAEQAAIGRAAAQERDAAQRTSALEAREREIAEMLEASRREAETIRTEARRHADHERTRAKSHATQLIAQVALIARQQHDDAAQEIERLSTIRDGIRDDLGKLHDVLDGALHRSDTTDASAEDARRSQRS